MYKSYSVDKYGVITKLNCMDRLRRRRILRKQYLNGHRHRQGLC